jgi:hypothetical protein
MICLLLTLPYLRPGLGPKQYKHFSYLGPAYLKEMQICVLCCISNSWPGCSALYRTVHCSVVTGQLSRTGWGNWLSHFRHWGFVDVGF